MRLLIWIRKLNWKAILFVAVLISIPGYLHPSIRKVRTHDHALFGALSAEEIQAVLENRLRPRNKKVVARPLAAHLMQLCIKHRFSPGLVLALIHTESTFNTKIVSKAGAIGLMQLLPTTAGFIAKRDGLKFYNRKSQLYDPFINLTLGVHYVSYLRDRFKNPVVYITAYNMGPNRIGQLLANNEFDPKVLKTYVKNIHAGQNRIRYEAKLLHLFSDAGDVAWGMKTFERQFR